VTDSKLDLHVLTVGTISIEGYKAESHRLKNVHLFEKKHGTAKKKCVVKKSMYEYGQKRKR
jgi:hypothetical protein